MPVLKKILKIFLWVVGSVVTLLILLAVIIQIPTVQNFIIHKATKFVSDKTHTRVEIEKIGISFPKSVFVQGLFLDDLSHDTLLYAEEVKVNMDMIGLIGGNIHMQSVSLKNLTGNISRTENDSLFNFNFLISAFADSVQSKEKDTTKTNSTEFAIDKISLSEIKLKYDDKYNGLYASISLYELNLKINELNLKELKFDVEDLVIEKLNGIVAINKKAQDSKTEKHGVLPSFLADKIIIKNSAFAFNDNTSTTKISAGINQLELNKADVNLNTEIISLNKILLNQSAINLSFTEPIPADSIKVERIKSESNWKVSVKNIDLNNNQVAYNIENRPEIKNSFDASHLNYKNLSIKADDALYSLAETKATVKNISVQDANGFEIKSFSTVFRMDEHSITANDLQIKTVGSSIDASANIKYTSLASLKDSLQNLFVNAQISPTTISSKDVLYFSPQLKGKPFFNEETNTVKLSGYISGLIKNLKGEKILITTGNRTEVRTDFSITGLPNAQQAYFDLPSIKIVTGRNDLEKLVGKKIVPSTISLPQNISLNGKFKGKIKAFETSFGLGTEYGSASAFMVIDKEEKFSGKVTIADFNVGLLLKNTAMFGPVTMQASVDGKGLNKNTITANVNVSAPSVYLNNYVYHNFSVDGDIHGQQFEGKISLNDSNAAFDFDGLVNISPGKEQYKFALDLKGADLKNLKITQDDLRISALAVADLKGKDFNSISGNAGVTQIVIAKHGVKYKLDSLVYASINEKRKSELQVSSAIVGIKYNGTFAPGNLVSEIKKHIHQYFPVLNEKEILQTEKDEQNFSFEIQLHNHPVLSEIFFPRLTEFEPGIITGSFSSEKDELSISANIKKIIYAGTEIENLALLVNSDSQKINYEIKTSVISTSQIRLSNFTTSGRLQDQKAFVDISSLDENGTKRLVVKTELQNYAEGFKIILNPSEFYLGNEAWTLPADNFIAFGPKGLLIHNLALTKSSREIKIASVNNQFSDDIQINVKGFELSDISRVVEKDTSLIEGNLNADVLLKRVNNNYGIIASAELKNLAIKKVNVGTLTLKADNPTREKFTIDVKLAGEGNDVAIDGYFIPKDSANALRMQVAINSLSVKAAEAFSMGQITEGAGNVNGKFSIEGNTKAPAINGSLYFKDVYLKPTALNNRLHFVNEKVEINPSGIYFSNFTIIDQENNSAEVNGTITMKEFSDWGFALKVNTNNFLVFNTTKKDNEVYYGRMIIDSRIDIKGTVDFPVIDSRVKLKDGSNFTFAVPEKKLTTDRGENVVLFVDSIVLHPIITRNEEIEKQKSEIKGVQIFSNIEVDPKATLRLLLDPTTNDSLVVRGDAALSFSLDPSGKISLTGTYSLTDGSYIVSLQSLIKKKFAIEPGSTIVWNGDPLDADVNINAIYTIRTSAINLVADQISGLSDAEKNTYSERLTFLVFLKMRGPLLKPELSFEIQLPPEDKGVLGGSVNAKLNQLNESPSELNKQVFALLVLNRFIQENPLETAGGGGTSALARNSVSSFLTAQLNQLGANIIPGVELNFNVQSYDDYTSGEAQGRTQVEIGLRKQLFNDKLVVQVGGAVDVEGERAKQNNASEITGDVSAEYKLTEDGRYRLKGFRHNQYEGALEGQLVETGVGILYTRDFDKWKEFFTRPKKKEENKNADSKDK